jgi:hypothetical protein
MMHSFQVGAEVICSGPDFSLLRTAADVAYESTSGNCSITVYSPLVSIKIILRGEAFIA